MTDRQPRPAAAPDAAGERLIALWHAHDAAGFLRALAADDTSVSPHQEHAGVRIRTAEPGRVELDWSPRAHICNRAGIVHGGYLALVLDDAAGLAGASLGERFIPMLTMDLRVEYLRPALPDQAYHAVGEVVHAGRSRIVSDGRIEDSDGRLLARASGSFTPNRAFLPERFAN